MNLSDDINRKFIEQYDVEDWQIETDSGWQDITSVKKTVPYTIWYIETQSGFYLECADDHIVFDQDYQEIFVKHCIPYQTQIITKNGPEMVVDLYKIDQSDNMYDITVESEDHRYYTNQILSHNTTCAAAFLLWKAMYNFDSTILVASHQYSGASEIMQRIRYAYEEIPDFIRAGVVEYNKSSITFDNGSRIISQATTEKTGRGLSLTLIYLDEFAFVDHNIATEFWTSLAPTLSTGGSCIITTTPNSETDQFSEIWREANKTEDEYGNTRPGGLGRNGFKAFTIDWRQVPRPEEPEEFEKIMRAKIGDDRWLREYGCEFVSFEETLIASHVLKSLHGQEPYKMTGRVRWYAPLKPNRIYLASLDPSMGTGGDNAAITVWSLPEFEQVAEWTHNKTDIKGQVHVLLDILTELKNELESLPGQEGRPEIYWSVENNSIGEAALQVIEATGEDVFPGDFVHEPRKKRKGFTTTAKTKIEACARLKTLLESDKMILSSKPLVRELKSFVRDNKSFSAKSGESDDIVMSLLLSVRILNEIQNWDDNVYERLANVISLDEDEDDPMPLIIA